MSEPIAISDTAILAARPARNRVDPERPYAWLAEPERMRDGRIADIATVFLTNRECPFHCLMCDLWKNTTTESVPVGAIPRQIEYALERLPPAAGIKLYNSGNFFDRAAIPREDLPAIAAQLDPFDSVIVENHPKLCGRDCVEFSRMIRGQLEVAIGLETAHPQVLRALNKGMTLDDFSWAVEFLRNSQIEVRAFVLLKPPFLDASAAEEWAVRSLEFAFARGVDCCTVIPTRGGNGIMEQLESQGQFSPPDLAMLEGVLEQGMALQRGRVFADLWDAERLRCCPCCGPARIQRLHQMNLQQTMVPRISCPNEGCACK